MNMIPMDALAMDAIGPSRLGIVVDPNGRNVAQCRPTSQPFQGLVIRHPQLCHIVIEESTMYFRRDRYFYNLKVPVAGHLARTRVVYIGYARVACTQILAQVPTSFC